MALRVREGGGTYTLTAGQAVGSQLDIVSLAGTSGFSRNARVYGFSSTSAAPTRTVTQTRTQTRTQTQTYYTQTQTQAQPTRTLISTSTRTAAGNAETAVSSVRQWLRGVRRRVATVARRLKPRGKKGKEKERKKVTKKTPDTSTTSAQAGGRVIQAQPATSGSGGQTKKRPRIATLFNMSAAAAPAGDPKDPGGSQTLTTVNDEKKDNRESAGSKATHGAGGKKKGRSTQPRRCNR